jgi:hypothetical protein
MNVKKQKKETLRPRVPPQEEEDVRVSGGGIAGTRVP